MEMQEKKVKVVQRMNDFEKRASVLELSQKEMMVEGYAIKFNTRSELLGDFVEIIDPHAFDGLDLSKTDVRAFLDHDSSKLLGRTSSGTLQLHVDDVGVRFNLSLPNTQTGRDAYELITRGDLNQCSFGFVVGEDTWDVDEDGTYIRTIRSIKKIFEISLVSIPAYSDTSVKLAQRSLDSFKEGQKRALELSLDLVSIQNTLHTKQK